MKAVLLYGAETWRLTDGAEAKVAGIYQQKLRHIHQPMEEEIRKGTWRWLATHRKTRRTCPQELKRTKMLKVEKKGLLWCEASVTAQNGVSW